MGPSILKRIKSYCLIYTVLNSVLIEELSVRGFVGIWVHTLILFEVHNWTIHGHSLHHFLEDLVLKVLLAVEILFFFMSLWCELEVHSFRLRREESFEVHVDEVLLGDLAQHFNFFVLAVEIVFMGADFTPVAGVFWS